MTKASTRDQATQTAMTTGEPTVENPTVGKKDRYNYKCIINDVLIRKDLATCSNPDACDQPCEDFEPVEESTTTCVLPIPELEPLQSFSYLFYIDIFGIETLTYASKTDKMSIAKLKTEIKRIYGIPVQEQIIRNLNGNIMLNHYCVSHKKHQNLVLFQSGLGGGKHSTVHDGTCSFCAVCKQQGHRSYLHIDAKQGLSEEEKDKICNQFKLQKSSCICKPCFLRLFRSFNAQRTENQPKDESKTSQCHLSQYGMCNAAGKYQITTKFQIIYECFGFASKFACSTFDIEEQSTVSLCDDHRLKLLRFKKKMTCVRCGSICPLPTTPIKKFSI